MVDVFFNDEKSRRGISTSWLQVLSMENEAGLVTGLGHAGKLVCVTCKDVCAALDHSELPKVIKESIDELEVSLALDFEINYESRD